MATKYLPLSIYIWCVLWAGCLYSVRYVRACARIFIYNRLIKKIAREIVCTRAECRQRCVFVRHPHATTFDSIWFFCCCCFGSRCRRHESVFCIPVKRFFEILFKTGIFSSFFSARVCVCVSNVDCVLFVVVVLCIQQPKHARTIAPNEMRAITIIDGEFSFNQTVRVHRTVNTRKSQPSGKKEKKNQKSVARSANSLTHRIETANVASTLWAKWKDKSHNDVYDFHSLCVFSAGTLHVRSNRNAMLRRACSNNNKYTLLARNDTHTHTRGVWRVCVVCAFRTESRVRQCECRKVCVMAYGIVYLVFLVCLIVFGDVIEIKKPK